MLNAIIKEERVKWRSGVVRLIHPDLVDIYRTPTPEMLKNMPNESCLHQCRGERYKVSYNTSIAWRMEAGTPQWGDEVFPVCVLV